MTGSTMLLIGGGQASAVAARTLRRQGYDGRVVIVGDERHRPYQRPPLSKEFLTEGDGSGLDLLPESWAEENDIEIRTGVRALKISAADSGVLLDDGTTTRADAILLATGSRSRRLRALEGDGVHYLRTRDDAVALREALVPGARVVLVGGGFIGGEVASAAHELGGEVTMLEAGPVPLAQAVGVELGAAYLRIPRAAGVDVRVDTMVDGLRREAGGMVVTTSRGDVPADVVVVGVGAVPNVDIAVDSGIDVAVDSGGGILVDERCRTSMDRVFAAGDVARHLHRGVGDRIRVEHFDHASRHGATASRNMLGESAAYEESHWFWSDQFGHNLQYVGHAGPDDRLVVRGNLEDDIWTAFFVNEDRVTAAFSLDAGEDIAIARELISARSVLPDEVLVDREVDLFEACEELL
jgi:3-phenylpropionate/trans-cinnamate dioxygenase ferredoxin reductase subunit